MLKIPKGLADWAKIRAVKEAVKVPVFANGNILYRSDIAKCLEATGADAVMCAEAQLYNAALFHSVGSDSTRITLAMRLLLICSDYHPPHADLALEYLEIVQSLKTKIAQSAVKGHLFKLMRPALSHEPDLRDRLSQVPGKGTYLEDYLAIVKEMKERMDVRAIPLVSSQANISIESGSRESSWPVHHRGTTNITPAFATVLGCSAIL